MKRTVSQKIDGEGPVEKKKKEEKEEKEEEKNEQGTEEKKEEGVPAFGSFTSRFSFGNSTFNFNFSSSEDKKDGDSATSAQPFSFNFSNDGSSPFSFSFQQPPSSPFTQGGEEEDDRDPEEQVAIEKEDKGFKELSKEDLATGEEGEDILMEIDRAKLFVLEDVPIVTEGDKEEEDKDKKDKKEVPTKKEWKERGKGSVKILENKEKKSVRVVMRRSVTLQTILNFGVLVLTRTEVEKAGKGVVIHSIEKDESGKPKTKTYLLKTADKEVAEKFSKIISDVVAKMKEKK